MVYEIASIEVVRGKDAEAREWARDIHEYGMKKFGYKGTTAVQVTPAPGEGGRITWISIHESLASWGEALSKMNEDAGWQERVKAHLDARLPSTFTRTVYRTL